MRFKLEQCTTKLINEIKYMNLGKRGIGITNLFNVLQKNLPVEDIAIDKDTVRIDQNNQSTIREQYSTWKN